MIVKKDKESILDYEKDASNLHGSTDIVFLPNDTNDILKVLEFARKNNRTIAISGSRTGLTGGCVPDNDIVLSLENMNRILEINKTEMYAWVEPGLKISDFHEELDKHGLYYPPNPTETNSSIGGNIANNASGSRAFKYGNTRPFVLEMQVILSNGEIVNLNGKLQNDIYEIKSPDSDFRFDIQNVKIPHKKNSAGYYSQNGMRDFDIFIGSEGTLGIVSKVKVKLIQKPHCKVSLLAFFVDYDNMFKFVEEARQKSFSEDSILDSNLIEFLDSTALELTDAVYPKETAGSIWIEQYCDSDEIKETILAEWYELITKYTKLAEDTFLAYDAITERKINEIRHKVPLGVTEFIAQHGFSKMGTDTAVADEFAKDLFDYGCLVCSERNIKHVVWGHIGNSHLHINVLPTTEEEYQKAVEAFDLILDRSLDYGGTISGEHGIGKIKKKHFHKMYEKELDYFKKIKSVFDPEEILGKGNLF